LHVDRDHPHVHLTVARRDYDGRRFNPDRDDLLRYRQRFAQKLRDRGIEANATPVQARGVDATHEPIAARKIREQGAVPRIDRNRADRARRLHETGGADPTETALAKRQAVVRDTFQRSIDELLTSSSFVDQVKAQTLRKFVAAMPEPVPSLRTLPGNPAIVSATHDHGQGATPADPIAEALARTQATNVRIAARRAGLPSHAIDPANPIAAALARMEAATARIAERRAQEASAADPVVLALARLEAARAEIEKRHQKASDAADPLTATLARINKAAEALAARGRDASAAGTPGCDRPADRTAAERPEQMRAPDEPERRPMPTYSTDSVDAFVRQTLERVRALEQERYRMLQRDRSQDRSGPRR
ncbi:relaxase/mobilization nuclease domain-containing protein, partial [Sphingomonas kyungheensis]